MVSDFEFQGSEFNVLEINSGTKSELPPREEEVNSGQKKNFI
jgi:hypothetical protein